MLYVNPHNPPVGGWRGSGSAFGPITGGGLSPQQQSNGQQGVQVGKWQPQVMTNTKSVEVQRSATADAVFSSLRSGDELQETSPPEGLVRTHLYPHQKKALTFLLEREGEREGDSKLWKVRGGLGDVGERLGVRGCEKGRKWVNVVTNKEVCEEPKECKGALLADDVSLLIVFHRSFVRSLSLGGGSSLNHICAYMMV